MNSQDVKRLTTTYPYVSQPNLYEKSLAPPGGLFFPCPALRKEKQKVLRKSGSFTLSGCVIHCYLVRSRIISMVETFRASWPSPTTSVPKCTFLAKPPWKKRLFTTSATSTAVLMARPRAFRVSFLAPVL